MQPFRLEPINLPENTRVQHNEVPALLTDDLTEWSLTPNSNSWPSFDGYFSRFYGQRGFIPMRWPRRYVSREIVAPVRYVDIEEICCQAVQQRARIGSSTTRAATNMLSNGSEEASETILPHIAVGECFFAIGMSDPDSGSELASVSIWATRANGGWRIDTSLVGELCDIEILDGVWLDTSAVTTLNPVIPDIVHWSIVLWTLQMAVTHTNTGRMFFYPIAKFQAIQQQLAVVAGVLAVAGTTATAQITTRTLESLGASLIITVGKARVGVMVSHAPSIGHQMLCGMCFTYKFILQDSTQPLRTKRDEFDTVPYWETGIGRLSAAQCMNGLWIFQSECLR